MPIPRFRFGGYMNATGGGTNRAASSSYSSPSSSSNNYGSPPDVSGYNAPSPAPQITGRIRDTKADEEANESSYLNTMMPGGNITYSDYQEGVANTAYQESLKRQADMRRAIDMAYGTNRLSDENQKAYDEETLRLLNLKGTENEVPDVGIGKRSIIDESPSTFHTLTDKQKQFLIDSGFAKAESSGILGGTFGAELAENRRRKELGLDYDRSAVYSFDDVESDDDEVIL